MPCSKHKDQDQRSRLVSVRSSFTRPFAGLRFSEQDLQSFSISLAYNPSINHNLVSPAANGNISSSSSTPPQSSSTSPNSEDPTERIRISVQDTHISQRRYTNNTGSSTSSNVLDDYNDDTTEQRSLQNRPRSLDHEEHDNLDLDDPRPLDNGPSASVSSNDIDTDSNPLDVMSNIHDMWPTQSDFDGDSLSLVEPTLPGDLSETHNDQSAAPQIKSTIAPQSLNRLNTTTKDVSNLIQSESNCSIFTGRKNESQDNQAKTSTASTPLSSPSSSEASIPQLSSDDQTGSEEFQSTSLISTPPIYRQMGVIKNYLYNGSSFSGFQKSKNESYEVNVKLQFVDYETSYLCGYLCINHLTKSHPSMTTFFEGEIISERYPFLTRKWEATEGIDRAHWSKFEHFSENYSQTFNLDSFSYGDLKDSDYIYMRWKERFLVPDHTVKHVEGASYAGFYYICYSKRTSSIRGYYFHINSEYFER